MLPVIDVSPLLKGNHEKLKVAQELSTACQDKGFFYITGHGIDEVLQSKLEELSHQFFDQSVPNKMKISMEHGGKAWRGYFPVGNELTSGKPDLKEGLYFGEELTKDDPRVIAGTPLHGKNLFPDELPALRKVVLKYIEALTHLGHSLMRGISLSLSLDENYFHEHYTGDPFILFRIFCYPPRKSICLPSKEDLKGVGEHTDYGVLTILRQDDCGGLEVKSRTGWISAPPLKGTFVCNIGDMLDRLTRGLYRSTAHRVTNPTSRSRLSFPFFFDPNFNSFVKPLPISAGGEPSDDKAERWDRSCVHDFHSTYGEYLLNKVGKVFPGLGHKVL